LDQNVYTILNFVNKKICFKSKCIEAQRHHGTLAIELTTHPATNIMAYEAAIRKQTDL